MVAAPPDPQGAGPPPVESSGTAVAPRLARLTLVVVLGSYAAILMANVLVTGGPVALMAGAAATIAAVAALQLRHSLGWRGESRPRGWRWTLAAQILLPFAWLPAYDWNILGLAGTAAGSALLLLPRRWGWTVFAAVMAGVGVAWSLPALDVYHGLSDRYGLTLDLVAVLYQLGAAATSAIVVYGLSRLTTVTGDLEATRRELARAAVERERLRVAQDTHDLLGLGLSAVALKSDLAGRLVGRDDTRARGELDALVRLAAQARAEVLAVTADERHRSLAAELPAAREVLASAGITAEVSAQTPVGSLPEEVAAVLAAALREAVTNVLRHAVATRCEIELTAAGHELVLRVANDGVADDGGTGEPRDREPGRRGHGLANMTARAAAVGGRLSSSAGGGRFELTVRVPLPAAGDAAHSVGGVVGGVGTGEEP